MENGKSVNIDIPLIQKGRSLIQHVIKDNPSQGKLLQTLETKLATLEARWSSPEKREKLANKATKLVSTAFHNVGVMLFNSCEYLSTVDVLYTAKSLYANNPAKAAACSLLCAKALIALSEEEDSPKRLQDASAILESTKQVALDSKLTQAVLFEQAVAQTRVCFWIHTSGPEVITEALRAALTTWTQLAHCRFGGVAPLSPGRCTDCEPDKQARDALAYLCGVSELLQILNLIPQQIDALEAAALFADSQCSAAAISAALGHAHCELGCAQKGNVFFAKSSTFLRSGSDQSCMCYWEVMRSTLRASFKVHTAGEEALEAELRALLPLCLGLDISVDPALCSAAQKAKIDKHKADRQWNAEELAGAADVHSVLSGVALRRGLPNMALQHASQATAHWVKLLNAFAAPAQPTSKQGADALSEAIQRPGVRPDKKRGSITRWRGLVGMSRCLELLGRVYEGQGVETKAEYFLARGEELGGAAPSDTVVNRFRLLLARLECKRNRPEPSKRYLGLIGVEGEGGEDEMAPESGKRQATVSDLDLSDEQDDSIELEKFQTRRGRRSANRAETDTDEESDEDAKADLDCSLSGGSSGVMSSGASKQLPAMAAMTTMTCGDLLARQRQRTRAAARYLEVQTLMIDLSDAEEVDASCPSIGPVAHIVARARRKLTSLRLDDSCARSGSNFQVEELDECLSELNDSLHSSKIKGMWPVDEAKGLYLLGRGYLLRASWEAMGVRRELLRSKPKGKGKRKRKADSDPFRAVPCDWEQSWTAAGTVASGGTMLRQAREKLVESAETGFCLGVPALTRQVCLALALSWGRDNTHDACFYLNLSLGVTARHMAVSAGEKSRKRRERRNRLKSRQETDDSDEGDSDANPHSHQHSDDDQLRDLSNDFRGLGVTDTAAQSIQAEEVSGLRQQQQVLACSRGIELERVDFGVLLQELPMAWTVCSIAVVSGCLTGSPSSSSSPSAASGLSSRLHRCPCAQQCRQLLISRIQRDAEGGAVPVLLRIPLRGTAEEGDGDTGKADLSANPSRMRGRAQKHVRTKASNDTGPRQDLFCKVMNDFDDVMEGNRETIKNAAAYKGAAGKKRWWTKRFELEAHLQSWLVAAERDWLGAWRGILSAQPTGEEGQQLSRLCRQLAAKLAKLPRAAPFEDAVRLLNVLVLGARKNEEQDVAHALAWLMGWVDCAKPDDEGEPRYLEGRTDKEKLLHKCMCVGVQAAATTLHALRRAHQNTQCASSCTLLILADDLKHLPWESLPVLRGKPVSRMPSLAFLLAHLRLRRGQGVREDTTAINDTTPATPKKQARQGKKKKARRPIPRTRSPKSPKGSPARTRSNRRSARSKAKPSPKKAKAKAKAKASPGRRGRKPKAKARRRRGSDSESSEDDSAESEEEQPVVTTVKPTRSRRKNTSDETEQGECEEDDGEVGEGHEEIQLLLSKGYYVLNPEGDLVQSQKRFLPRFQENAPCKAWAGVSWEGVSERPPSADAFSKALSTQQLVVYMGHNTGAHFLSRDRIANLTVEAVTLLIGCSSAKLSYVQGSDFEAHGMVLSYVIAGCPAVVGNLWDVTDKDIDRYSEELLLQLDSDNPVSLNAALSTARESCRLKFLIGCAPVCYGLPVSLLCRESA